MSTMTPDHERIWLQNDNDAHGCEGRLWCQDKVWPEDDEQGEPTEYVRADLFRDLEERMAKAAEALEPFAAAAPLSEHWTDDFIWNANQPLKYFRRAREALRQIRSEK